MKNTLVYMLLVAILFVSCGPDRKLRYYVALELDEKGDTIFHQIPPFELTNYDGQTVTNESVKGKIKVVDFFFTSCSQICPVIKKEMKLIQEEYGDNERVVIMSHTIDPDYDTPARLGRYAEGLGAKKDFWYFLTGEKDYMWKLSRESYFMGVMANEEAKSQGEKIDHTDFILLIDGEGYIRGKYHGLESEEIEKLIEDIDVLLDE